MLVTMVIIIIEEILPVVNSNISLEIVTTVDVQETITITVTTPEGSASDLMTPEESIISPNMMKVKKNTQRTNTKCMYIPEVVNNIIQNQLEKTEFRKEFALVKKWMKTKIIFNLLKYLWMKKRLVFLKLKEKEKKENY